jgi:negative regulator of flagellin synthesis FlgM
MKIGHLENKAITPAVSERRAGGSATTGAAEPSAKVALSSAATQLAADPNEGVFDTEKVKRISDAIRDGKFEVNAEAIADKLISNAQELLGNVGKA